MEELTQLWLYFAIALFGGVVHIIKKIAVEEENNVSFNANSWFKRNKYRSILGILLACAGVFVLMETNQLNFAAAFACGFMGNSFMNKENKSK